MGEVKTKVCTKCEIEKELSEFSIDNRIRKGLKLRSACKLCKRLSDKNYRSQSHVKLMKKNNRKKRRNKETIEQKLKRCKKRRERYNKNKHFWKESAKLYYIKNKTKIAKYKKLWNLSLNGKLFSRKKSKKMVDELRDCYVKRLISTKNIDIPTELIEVKRLQLQITRELRG